MDKKNSLLAFLLCFSVLGSYANGELLVLSDVAPNITIEVLSDTQVRLTNHNLAVGYAVDVYMDDVFQPRPCSLTENDLLGLGLFGGFFGTKTKVITLPDALMLTRFRLEMYAKILPEGHPRREFSRQVALKNMDAAFTGMLTNILNFFGVVEEAPKVAKFASDIVRAGGASDRFLDGDLAGGFNKLATWAASEVGKAGILIAAQEVGISISAGTASLIGGMVAVAFTLPTVWDVIVSDPQLYHSITLELRTNEISPSYGIITNGRCTDPDGWCYKDTIPTFDIGDALWFSATVFNRSTVPLFNVSLEASLYGPDDRLVEHSAGGGFNLVWNYEPYYPKYFDLAPYGDPLCYAPVGLKPDYPLTVSSTGHQYRGGLYRLETQLLGWYGSDTLGSSANYIKILDGQAPGAPQLVTGEVVGDNIALSWRPPPNTYDISYYIVRRFPNANRTGDVRVFTVEVPERKTPSEKLTKVAPYLLDEFVEPGVGYYYEVKIVDWDDLESEWSPLFGPVTITPYVPEEGHDVTIQLYVNDAGVTHLPGQSTTGEIWATNSGNYTESGNLQVCIEKSSGETPPLDSRTYSFSNLTIGGSTPRYPFSLSSGNYEGEARVRATAIVQYDENRTDNEMSVPIYFSRNLNPTDSFDGFEFVEITSGQTKIVVDRRGQRHTIEFIGINDPQGNCITIIIDGEWMSPCLGDYIFGLPWAVIQLGYRKVGTWTYGFYFWWPDNIYKFSHQYLTVPWGGTTTFEISRTSGSWYNIEDYTVEFLSGLLPTGWSSSVTIQDYRLVVKVQAAHGGTINFTFDGWAHLHEKNRVVNIYTDAFKWMRFQTVSIAPETVITSGPEGTVFTRTVTFEWDGSDDTTPNSQLQYAYRLDPCEPEFGPFLTDTTKMYHGLADGNYTFYVKARDLEGNEDSTPASRDFNIVTNREPNLPINQYPQPGQTNTSLSPTLVGSSFSDPDFGDVFAKSRFQVRTTAGTYDTPVWDSGELTPATNVSQVTDMLLEATEYFWRCRYRDDKGAWSEWSNETSFSTVLIHPCEEYLTLMNCELAYQRRISRTVYEYIFWLRATNNSLVDLKDVTVRLVAEPNNTTVLDDTVKFSLIKAGMEALTDDTFKIRIDRSIEGSESDVIWQICDCKIDDRLGFNYNSDINLAELAAFTEAWLESREGLPQDLYPDGKVNFIDFATFAEKWRK